MSFSTFFISLERDPHSELNTLASSSSAEGSSPNFNTTQNHIWSSAELEGMYMVHDPKFERIISCYPAKLTYREARFGEWEEGEEEQETESGTPISNKDSQTKGTLRGSDRARNEEDVFLPNSGLYNGERADTKTLALARNGRRRRE